MREVFAAARVTAESGPNNIIKYIMKELKSMNPTPSQIEELARKAVDAHNFVIERDTTDEELAWLKEWKRLFPDVALAQAILALAARCRDMEKVLKPWRDVREEIFAMPEGGNIRPLMDRLSIAEHALMTVARALSQMNQPEGEKDIA